MSTVLIIQLVVPLVLGIPALIVSVGIVLALGSVAWLVDLPRAGGRHLAARGDASAR